MKALLSATALAFALPGMASAVTFAGNFNVTGDAFSDPGLDVEVSRTNGSFLFDLDVGESYSLNIFKIWTNEGAVNRDDTVPNALNVLFALTSPVTGGSVSGTVTGFNYFFTQFGSVDFSGPVDLAFGNGGILSVALSDTTFNQGLFGLNSGRDHGAHVAATFTYTQAPTEVPLPAPALLLATALAGLGLAARRRAA